MHILLTDRLICPRCGPDFGLILLADLLEDRRVMDGRLGCPNCREQYEIRRGIADLRYPPGPPLSSGEAEISDGEAAVRLAALLGLAHGGGMVVLAGTSARLASTLSGLVDDIEFIAVQPDRVAAEEGGGVSRVAAVDTLPFASRSIRGVALTGGDSPLVEAERILARGGRIVVESAARDTVERLRKMNLEILLQDEGVVVASPPATG